MIFINSFNFEDFAADYNHDDDDDNDDPDDGDDVF